MQTVFTNEMTVHTWAAQSQEYGRNSSGSIFFDGDSIYSYGRHFKMSRFLTDRDNQKTALITGARYSNTTANHLHKVRMAMPSGVKVYTVENPDAKTKPEHKANFAEIESRYKDSILRASRARTYKQMALDTAETLFQQANDYSNAFRLGVKIKPASVDDIKEAAKKQAAKIKRENAKKQKAGLLEFNDNLNSWKRGEISTSRLPFRFSCPIHLRVSGNESQIETTRGASFPLADCARAWAIIARCKKQGNGWKPEPRTIGIRLGSFGINSISPAGNVVAGCHNIKFAQLLTLALRLKLAAKGEF